MAALPPFTSPFPLFHLPNETHERLQRLVQTLTAKTLARYEHFIWVQQSRIDARRWRVLRECEDVRVFQARETNANALQVLVTTGTLAGKLEDAVLGFRTHTTDAMRLRAAYADDHVVNGAVLATLQDPTVEAPFRSTTIKWMVARASSMGVLHGLGLMKYHDGVFVDSTDLHTLSNGEKVGVHVLHSIDLPSTQALPSCTRARFSVCAIWRQQSPDRLEMYATSFLDHPSALWTPLLLRSAADLHLAMLDCMYATQMTKLAWLFEHRGPCAGATTDLLREKTRGGPNVECACCSSSGQLFRRGKKHLCVTCRSWVCGTCRVQRPLFSVLPDGRLHAQQVDFCVPCWTIAMRLRAADLARDGLLSESENDGLHKCRSLPVIRAHAAAQALQRTVSFAVVRASAPNERERPNSCGIGTSDARR